MKAMQIFDAILGVVWAILAICFGMGVLEVTKTLSVFMAVVIALESFANIFQREV